MKNQQTPGTHKSVLHAHQVFLRTWGGPERTAGRVLGGNILGCGGGGGASGSGGTGRDWLGHLGGCLVGGLALASGGPHGRAGRFDVVVFLRVHLLGRGETSAVCAAAAEVTVSLQNALYQVVI